MKKSNKEVQDEIESVMNSRLKGFFEMGVYEQEEIIDMMIVGMESQINRYDTKLMGFLKFQERNEQIISRLIGKGYYEVVHALKQAILKVEEKYKQINLIEELCQH
jgi:hypothetical protein